jgi:hypothetical protein
MMVAGLLALFPPFHIWQVARRVWRGIMGPWSAKVASPLKEIELEAHGAPIVVVVDVFMIKHLTMTFFFLRQI